MEVVCYFFDEGGVDFLFGFGVDDDDAEVPAAEGEAGYTAVCAWSEKMLVGLGLVGRPELQLRLGLLPKRQAHLGLGTDIIFCSVMTLIVLLTCRNQHRQFK